MPAASARSMQRKKQSAALKEGRRVFLEAIRCGEMAEKNLKQVVNTLPARLRLAVAVRILCRRWI